MSFQEQNSKVPCLSQMLCEHIVEGAKHLENRIHTSRALTFTKAFIPVMTYLRDQNVADLMPSTLQDYAKIEKLIDLTFNENNDFGADFQVVVKPLANYLKALPGFNAEEPLAVNQKLADQHSLVAMLMVRVTLEMVTFGTSTMGVDFIGKDMTQLMVAYEESLIAQENLDNLIFLKGSAEDSLFVKEDSLFDSEDQDAEHNLFLVSPETNIFTKSDVEDQNNPLNCFGKKHSADEDLIFIEFNKAS